MRLGAILGSLAVLLGGCVDRGRCLRSHEETGTYLMPVMTGIANGVPLYTYIPMPQTQEVCDEWEFPEGREK